MARQAKTDTRMPRTMSQTLQLSEIDSRDTKIDTRSRVINRERVFDLAMRRNGNSNFEEDVIWVVNFGSFACFTKVKIWAVSALKSEATNGMLVAVVTGDRAMHVTI
jgi:hypothetical protein